MKSVYNCVTSDTRGSKIHESVVTPALLMVFGIVGNSIALTVLFFSANNHKWRPFYRLVASLAVTDGFCILLVYPIAMITYAKDFTFCFSKPLCDYDSFVFVFMLIASAGIVCCMSIDRFFAILFPIMYNQSGKRKRANYMIGVIWTGSAVISSLHLIGLGSTLNVYPGSWCFLNFVNPAAVDRINAYIYAIVGLILLSVTIVLNFIIIFRTMKDIFSKDCSNSRNMQRDLYIVFFLLAIVTTITSCFGPLTILILQHAALIVHENGPRELYFLRQAVLNAAIDPWIYILLRKDHVQFIYRKLLILRRRLCPTQYSDTPRRESEQTSSENYV